MSAWSASGALFAIGIIGFGVLGTLIIGCATECCCEGSDEYAKRWFWWPVCWIMAGLFTLPLLFRLFVTALLY